MNRELDIFGVAKVTMDTYKSRYDRAKAKKEQRFKDLNTNYKPGSPMFVQERDKITPEYEKEIESARDKCRREFTEILENTIAKEKAKVAVITGSTKEILSTLSRLENMTISLDEYQTLVDSFGNKLYWVDRVLERLGERCGVMKTGLQPSLTAKLQILSRLEADVTEFLDDYDGEDDNQLIKY